MATEKGIVTSATQSMIWIKTLRSSACEACEANDTCTEKENFKEMMVQVENTLDAAKGDHVVLGFNTVPLLKLTFMLYIFPILFLIAGAAAGQAAAPLLKLDQSLASLLAGLLCFATAFAIIKKFNTRLARKKEYRPYLVRILNRTIIPR